MIPGGDVLDRVGLKMTRTCSLVHCLLRWLETLGIPSAIVVNRYAAFEVAAGR